MLEILREFEQDLSALKPKAIVAHNVAFDLPIILAEFERLRMVSGCSRLRKDCTMLAARRRWPGESARLADVYERLFRIPLNNAHSAGSDAWACAQVFFSLGLDEMNPRDD